MAKSKKAGKRYYAFKIGRGELVDVLLSTRKSPTLPEGWAVLCPLGSVVLNI